VSSMCWSTLAPLPASPGPLVRHPAATKLSDDHKAVCRIQSVAKSNRKFGQRWVPAEFKGRKEQSLLPFQEAELGC
jgi:hypothetical protein